MRPIGLIGGMSWESTAVYYRLLNERARERFGGLHSAEILLWSVDFARIERMQADGDWARAGEELAAIVRRLEAAGAGCIAICTNTMHKVAGEVAGAVRVPLVHIADATAAAVRHAGCKRPLLLATRYTMEQDFYRGRLAELGVDTAIPPEPARSEVHSVIYEELCRGQVRPESRARYVAAIKDAARAGADGVILGCTEIGLLIGPGDTDLPLFDTTALHADAILEAAITPLS
ncbi:aspartate/glutamate racemase family protein [Rhodosalinus sp. K401]|uniref:aspartate/glutamate racemase family protein n=1 Tax=Rhodosalinus sp. K401 TaxID=3239195 RepID=UPI00352652C9